MTADALLTVTRVYPPDSQTELETLHEQIIASSPPEHYKHSVLYYLLKDLSHANEEVADDFARSAYLPDKYKIFVDGIWLLDRLKFEVRFLPTMVWHRCLIVIFSESFGLSHRACIAADISQ